ncbi:MAG: lysylphosphatidylglycerol synthase domain-containing protein [Patescibacteria group bacterium]
MKKIALNIASVLIIIALFYFLGREFLKNWSQIRSFPLHFDLLWLFWATAAYFITFFLLSIGWTLILKSLHYPISLTHAFLFFIITQPAKYIPGKIWIAVARMKFMHPLGIPNSVTLLSTGAEGVLEILAGSYISLVAILQIPGLGKFSVIGTIIISLLGVVLLIPKVFYAIINLYLKLAKREPIHATGHAKFAELLFLQIVYLIGMFGVGLAQVLFLKSFTHVSPHQFPLLISIGSFSYVASILAIFTPGGLGVREGIWYLALKGISAPHIAIIFALASRIWTVVAEALFLFIALPILWLEKRRNKKSLPHSPL